MKSKLTRSSVVFCTAIVLTLSAHAADRYWDGTSATGNADGGNGTWDTSTSNWDSAASGGSNVLFTSGDNASFGGVAGTVTTAAAFDAGTVTFDTAGYSINTNGNAMTWTTLAGSGGFTKTGAGILTLSNASTASGNVSINGGEILLSNSAALGTTAVTLNGGNLTAGATVSNNIAVDAGGGILRGTSAYTPFSGILSGNGPLTVQGYVQLTNTSNTYGGSITISTTTATYLRLSASEVLAPTTSISYANEGSTPRLRLDGGVTQTIADLSSTRDGQVFVTTDGNKSARLKVGAGNYAGHFSNDDGTSLTLEKIGAGTFTLNRNSGNIAKIFAVEVTQGTLTLAGVGVGTDNGYFKDATPITVKSGGLLSVTQDWNIGSQNKVTVDGGTIAFDAGASDKNYMNGLVMKNGATINGAWRTGNVAATAITTSGNTTNIISGDVTLVKNGSTVITVDVANGSAASDLEISGQVKDLSGSAGATLEKSGAGTLLLSNANNSYTGATTVSAGTLVVNGNISTSTLTVGSSGTLSGNGIVGTTTVLGRLAIGSSPGTMTFDGNLTLGAGSNSDFEINSFADGTFDLAKAATLGSQAVNFDGGTLNILFQSGFNTIGSVKIFDFDSYAGTSTAFNPTGLADGYTASFDYTNGMVTVVPEPAAALLGGLGMLILLRRRR